MASSSAGSASSSRRVERTLSDSSVGNVGQSSRGSRSKGKGKPMDVDDDDDDVIIIGSWDRPSNTSQTRSSSSRRAAAAGHSRARAEREEPNSASSASQTAAPSLKNSTQRKRKPIALPGDGFRMDFRQSHRSAATSIDSHALVSRLKEGSLQPSSSSQLYDGSAKSARAVPTSTAGLSHPSLPPPSLHDSTQSKPKQLRPIPRPPIFSLGAESSSTSLNGSSTASKPFPSPSTFPSSVLPLSVGPGVNAEPKPAPPSSSTRRVRVKRDRSPPPARSSRTALILASTDWSAMHPCLEASQLFRLEYAHHDGLRIDQVRNYGSRAVQEFKKTLRPSSVPAPVRNVNPSWLSDESAVAQLKTKLGEKEHFVALVWAKDVLGRNKKEEGSISKPGELRREVIGGVDMWLLGKEFPLQFVTIVGVVVGIFFTKDDQIGYEVDDGTAVISCRCSVKAPNPAFLPPARELYPNGMPKTPSPRKRKAVVLEETVAEDQLEVGMLVKVVGTIGTHWHADGDRDIAVEKIERLRDHNQEVQHHIKVARLHQELYSQPFDLNGRLDQIRRDEIEKWSHLPSSQASSSVAGTPKKIRFRRPVKLAIDDITPQNFITYIRQHLRDHHVDIVVPAVQPPSPSAMPASSPIANGGWAVDFGSPDLVTVETPRPFTLDDLESDRDLRVFATRLAQKHEMEKRLKRKGRAVKKGEIWVRKDGRDGGVVRTQGIGSFGGSSLLLPTISSGATSSKRRKAEDGQVDDSPLSGDQLETAISKRFRQALLEMRRKGVIVVNVVGAEESSWPRLDQEVDSLPDEPSYDHGSARRTATAGPWNLEFDLDQEEDPQPAQLASGPSHRHGHPGRQGMWDLEFDLDKEESEPLREKGLTPGSSHQNLHSRITASTGCPWALDFDEDAPDERNAPAKSRASAKVAPWEPIFVSDNDDGPSERRATAHPSLPPQTTPRKSSPPQLATTPSTVKPIRTQRFALDQRDTAPRESPVNNTEPTPPRSASNRQQSSSPQASADRSFLTDSSWSDSIEAVDEETFELVTHTSVSGPVLAAINRLYQASKSQKRVDRAVSERSVREALVQHERWEQVARFSELVSKALIAMEKTDQIQKVGQDRWIPLRGLGFGKRGL